MYLLYWRHACKFKDESKKRKAVSFRKLTAQVKGGGRISWKGVCTEFQEESEKTVDSGEGVPAEYSRGRGRGRETSPRQSPGWLDRSAHRREDTLEKGYEAGTIITPI